MDMIINSYQIILSTNLQLLSHFSYLSLKEPSEVLMKLLNQASSTNPSSLKNVFYSLC